MLFFLTQFGITFVTIFLRGVQTHNVMSFNYKGAALTSVALLTVVNLEGNNVALGEQHE